MCQVAGGHVLRCIFGSLAPFVGATVSRWRLERRSARLARLTLGIFGIPESQSTRCGHSPLQRLAGGTAPLTPTKPEAM